MQRNIKREYRRQRAQGWTAPEALRRARTDVRFQHAEDAGLVRLRCEGDDMNPVDMFDAPEGVIERESKRAERDGVWWWCGEYRTHPDSNDWEIADSIGGFIGDDFDGSGYDDDVKSITLGALVAALRSECPHRRRVADYLPIGAH